MQEKLCIVLVVLVQFVVNTLDNFSFYTLDDESEAPEDDDNELQIQIESSKEEQEHDEN